MTEEFSDLVGIMARLRAPGGCPWDREQSREDLKTYLVEETYEVLDAIDRGDPSSLKEELGDLLLQVVFHAQIADEEKSFDIWDVCRAINGKLIGRHPHVFGEVKADTPDQVLKNWEAIKKAERGGRASSLDGVPKVLPALLKAYRLQQKASRVGFDWKNISDVEGKVDEEWRELKEAAESGRLERVKEELGDYLFAIVNLARFLKVDPEDALQMANEKFTRRFRAVEEEAKGQGRDIHGMALEEMDEIWEEVKKREASGISPVEKHPGKGS